MRKVIIALSFMLLTSIPLAMYSCPAQILIIRHGEKPEEGNNLSKQGFERANALRFYFEYDPFVLDFGIPKAVFAAKPKTNKGSKRSIQTVMPFANAFKMEINTSFYADQTAALAEEIMINPAYKDSTVLICWMREGIDRLCTLLGVEPAPPPYPGNHFDLVYKITYSSMGPPQFEVGLQVLMPDDTFTLPDQYALHP